MRIFIFSLLLLVCASSFAVELQEGQVWTYKTRVHEEDSTITILKIENYPDLGKVVHIRVEGIRLKNPLKGNIVTDIPHLPFKYGAIEKSVTELNRKKTKIPDFDEGYRMWKKAYLAGEAGAFESTIDVTLNLLIGGHWEEKE
ncbi:hypothetical protein [Aquirhabdus parva]|uniref:Uncharacterized protein n=1 Tax=Aquirhabdus parva TaxID=2283318 RepID=A0A345P466_9GAMM|nr:hypothetical protein [Aquirhabdus parva]AXI02075.1 hypothetical protein HYN46_03895 [Aquirhabdus parva]